MSSSEWQVGDRIKIPVELGIAGNMFGRHNEFAEELMKCSKYRSVSPGNMKKILELYKGVWGAISEFMQYASQMEAAKAILEWEVQIDHQKGEWLLLKKKEVPPTPPTPPVPPATEVAVESTNSEAAIEDGKNMDSVPRI